MKYKIYQNFVKNTLKKAQNFVYLKSLMKIEYI